MVNFLSRQNLNQSIFILGSYFHPYVQVLDQTRDFLKSKGYLNVFLASDIRLEMNGTYRSKNHENYERVEKLLESSDFCFFIFFQDHNESLKIELTTFLKSSYFPDKNHLILLPRELEIESMLNGLFDQQEVNIFRYDGISEIAEKCLKFVRYQ
jgi:hypothetical protein